MRFSFPRNSEKEEMMQHLNFFEMDARHPSTNHLYCISFSDEHLCSNICKGGLPQSLWLLCLSLIVFFIWHGHVILWSYLYCEQERKKMFMTNSLRNKVKPFFEKNVCIVEEKKIQKLISAWLLNTSILKSKSSSLADTLAQNQLISFHHPYHSLLLH